MKTYIEKVFKRESLSRSEAESAMDLILEGHLPVEQVAAFLGAVQAKEETVDELIGFLNSIRKRCPQVPLKSQNAIDVCGTGGDSSATFNISTAVALVVAAAKVPIAKHGNRSVSSLCGSADVLEALKVSINLKPDEAARSIDEIGFGFFFAPNYHAVLAKVREIRKAIGVKTVFNLLGPMTNPARVQRQLLGVYDSSRIRRMAEVLKGLGTQEAMVVCSEDGLDELSLSTPTFVAHLKDGQVREYKLSPEDFNLKRAHRDTLKGGDAQVNARIITEIFDGKKGPCRDVVILNSAAALVVAGRAKNWQDGAQMSAQVIDSGEVRRLLERLRS